jgi:hypothetical protein
VDSVLSIYLPAGSLVINNEDWTQNITNLTYGVTPTVADWYPYTETSNILNVLLQAEDINSTPGVAYGHVKTVSYGATATAGENSYKISDGINPLMHGKFILEFVRTDAGDSSSLYKSIAVQGTSNGILDTTTDFTLELHGFKDKTAILGTLDGTDVTYTHKMPVREEEISTGAAVLRWADVPSGGTSVFRHPFKVTSTELNTVNVQFGRVYEERVWRDAQTEPKLSYDEFTYDTGSGTFSETTGIDITLGVGSIEEYLIIAINSLNETSLTDKTYIICTRSQLTSGNYDATPIAKATRATTSDPWTIEQIITTDYTFPRIQPVPFDITKYGSKWVMYIPLNSLVVNQKDWSHSIEYLTSGISAIIGDWYEYDITKNYIGIYPNSFQTGLGFGSVARAEYGTDQYGLSGKGWKLSNGAVPLMKGAIDYEFIRPDSGDIFTKYRSIATQGTDNGIIFDSYYVDSTIELHGFKNNTQIAGTLDGTDTTYTHKIAVREEEIATGKAELRWADLPTPAEPTPFTHPWQALVTAYGNGSGDTISIQIGRVYEANTSNTGQSYPTNTPFFCFREITSSNSYTPGSVVTLTAPTTADTLCVTVTSNSADSIGDTYQLEWEGSTSSSIFARLATYTPGSGVAGTFEQIAMGAVWRSVQQAWSFALGKFNGNRCIHIPANSIWINAANWTTTSSLSGAGPTDWYTLPIGILSAYILMSYADGEYGKVQGVTLDTSIPSHQGEIITIPLADNQNTTTGVCNGLVNGAIYLDILRPDAAATDPLDLNIYKSIEAFGVENHTIGLEAFRAGTASQDPFDEADSYSHMFPVRETNSLGKVYLRWYDSAFLKDAIEAEIADQIGVIDWGSVITWTEIFTDYWENWYDDQYPDGKFWELGGDYSLAYGSSIGSDASTKVIDLTNNLLHGVGGGKTVDWANHELWDSGGGVATYSLNWVNRDCKNSSELVVLSWEDQILSDDGGKQSVLWSGRTLRDSAEAIVLDWANSALMNSTTKAVDWANHQLTDVGNPNGYSLSWVNRDCKNSAGNVTLNWENQLLTDQSGNGWQSGTFVPATNDYFHLGISTAYWASACISDLYIDEIRSLNGQAVDLYHNIIPQAALYLGDGGHEFAGLFLNSTGAIYFNGIEVLKARQASVTAPTGGSVIDAEARTAINDLIARLDSTNGHGLIT